MSRIFLDPDALKQSDVTLQRTKKSLQNSYQALHTIRKNPVTLNNSMYRQLTTMMTKIDTLQVRMQHISSFMSEAPLQYADANNMANSLAQQLRGPSTKATSQSTAYDELKKKEKPSKWKSYFWNTTESEFDHFNLKDGLGKILKDGLSIGGTYGAAIAKAVYRDKILNSDVGLDIAAGNFKVNGRCHANWKKDGKFDPSLSASVGAEASLAHGKAFVDYTSKYFGAGVSGKGSVGVVSAKAKAVINKKEVTIEGDIGAALAKGECSGKVKLFGITFTATLSGEVGAVGASAKYSSTSNSIEFGGKVAFLFGGGFNFKVDY